MLHAHCPFMVRTESMPMQPQRVTLRATFHAMLIGIWAGACGQGLAQKTTPYRAADPPVTSGRNLPQSGPTPMPLPAVSNVQVAQRLGPPTRQLGSPVQQSAGSDSQPVTSGIPFHLSSVEQQFVDQVLMMWENESSKITTYSCDFERWEYDPVFGPGEEIPLIKSQGQLTYAKPDKGSFKINTIQRWVRKDPQDAGSMSRRKTRWASIGFAMARPSTNTNTTKNSWSCNRCRWRCVVNRLSMVRCRFCLERKRKR